MNIAITDVAKDPAALAALIDSVIMNQKNSIVGRDMLLLRNAVDDLRAMACEHPNADLYHFNATRSSGSCRDCGADVRTPAQQ
jgi:hypothetical protein